MANKIDRTSETNLIAIKLNKPGAHGDRITMESYGANLDTIESVLNFLVNYGFHTGLFNEFKGVLDTEPPAPHNDGDWYIDLSNNTLRLWHDAKWNDIGVLPKELTKQDILTKLGITESDLSPEDKSSILNKLGLNDTQLTQIKNLDSLKPKLDRVSTWSEFNTAMNDSVNHGKLYFIEDVDGADGLGDDESAFGYIEDGSIYKLFRTWEETKKYIANQLLLKADKVTVDSLTDRVETIESQVSNIENTWTGSQHFNMVGNDGQYNLSTLTGDKGDFDFTAGRRIYVKLTNGDVNKIYDLKVGGTPVDEVMGRATFKLAIDANGLIHITDFVGGGKNITDMTITEIEQGVKATAAVVDAYTEGEVDAKLDLKADKTELTSKADKAYVDTQVDAKADKLALQLGLDAKADKTYVDSGLDTKADDEDTLSTWAEEMVYHVEGARKYIKYVDKAYKNERQVIEVVAVSVPGVGDILTYQSPIDIHARLTRHDATFGGTAVKDGTTSATYQNPSAGTKKFSFELTKDQWYKVRYDGTKLYLKTNGVLKIDGNLVPTTATAEFPITATDFLDHGKSNAIIQLPTGSFTEGDNVLDLNYKAHAQTFNKFFNQEIADLSERMKHIKGGGAANSASTNIAQGATNTQYLFIAKNGDMIGAQDEQEFEWVPASTLSSPLAGNTQVFMGSESTGFDPIINNGDFGDTLSLSEMNGGVVDSTKKYVFKYHAAWPNTQAPDHYQGKPYWELLRTENNITYQTKLSNSQIEVTNANAYTDADKAKVATIAADDVTWKTSKQDSLSDNEKQVLAGLPFTQPDKDKLGNAITSHQDISGKVDQTTFNTAIALKADKTALDAANAKITTNTNNISVINSAGVHIPHYNDATARDAAITSPSDGDVCYLGTSGAWILSTYENGAWVEGHISQHDTAADDTSWKTSKQDTLTTEQLAVVNANVYTNAEKAKVATIAADDTSWKTSKQNTLTKVLRLVFDDNSHSDIKVG